MKFMSVFVKYLRQDLSKYLTNQQDLKVSEMAHTEVPFFTPFTQLLPTRVCFTNAGVNTYGAEIHKVRKHAIYAFPSFLFLILDFM